MQAVRLITAPLQVGRHFIYPAFGGAEYQSLAEALRIQHAAQRVHFLIGTHFVINLFNGGYGKNFVRHAQQFRVLQKAFAQFQNGAAHRGGEHDLLTGGGRPIKNGFNILAEAHIQHFVGFVQHGDAHAVELQGSAFQMIDDSARRAHDDLHAPGQGTELSFNGLSSVNREDVQIPPVRGQPAEFFGYLNGQFARGAQNNRLDISVRHDLFQNGQSEGSRFARARLRLPHDVPTGEQGRNRQKLNGRRLFKAHIFNGFQEFRGKAQFFKCCAHRVDLIERGAAADAGASGKGAK